MIEPTGRQKPGLGSRRYPREVILKAIEQVNGGASMSSVAKEIGVRTNVVKYWIDHADNFLGPEGQKALSFETGLDDYTRQRFHRDGWAAVYEAIRQSKKKFKDAPLDQITRYIEVLTDKLARLAAPPGRGGSSAKASGTQDAHERAIQEIEVMVARFTRNRSKENDSLSQRASPVEDEEGTAADAPVIDVTADEETGKGAKEGDGDAT